MSRLCLLAMLLVASTSAAWAQDSAGPLQHFSKDVDVLIRMKSPDRTLEKVTALVNAVQPGAGAMFSQQAENLGVLIANPKMTGVDNTKDWYVGVYSNQVEQPIVVFGIPATDVEDMQDVLGDKIITEVHDNYVFYTEKQFEIPQATADSNATSELTEQSLATFSEGDLSLFINADHLAGVYADQIDVMQDQVLDGLNNLRALMPRDQGINVDAIIDMYGTVAEGVFQGVEDGTSCTVAISVSESGVDIKEYLDFKPSTPTANYFSGLEPSDLSMISKLPADGQVYYAAHGGLKKLAEWGLSMTGSMVTDEDTKAEFDKVTAEFSNLDLGGMAGSMSISTTLDNGIINASAIAQATPIDNLRKIMRKMNTVLSDIDLNGVKQTSKVDEDAETYGDYKADVITITQEVNEALDPTGMQKKMRAAMFGEEGMTTRTLYMEDQYLTSMGGGKPAMETLLKSVESDSGNSTLEEYRKPLLEKANLLFLIDIPGAVGRGVMAATQVADLDLPVDASMIENLNLQTSYIGYAMGSEPNALRMQTHIPITQIQGIAKLGAMFAALRMQQF